MYLPTIFNATYFLNASSDCLPSRRELPEIPGAPPGAAWFWGEGDELGRLNMLTTERVAAASKLIKTGQVVNLDLTVDFIDPPTFDRNPFNLTLIDMGMGAGWDDEYEQNPQSTSHWDGFRHVSTQFNSEPIFYNNITVSDIENLEGPGIAAFAEHGIVGRGVLIDYWACANKSYDPFTSYSITLDSLLSCAKKQNTTFQYGDILIIRSGWTDVYRTFNSTQREDVGGDFVGVEQSEAMLDFLHDNYFAAVAGDTAAFEAYGEGAGEPSLHPILLPLWGLTIGELWDLEELAEIARENKRWEFFFASSPANVPGGVASLANSLAVF